jgi:hypothetical protein
LRCELFRYSHQNIDTGVEEVDHVEHTLSYTIEVGLGAGTGDYYINERVYQGANLAYSSASAEVKDWNKSNNKIYLMNVVGEFTANTTLIGSDSNTRYTVSNSDTLGDFLDYDIYDNRQIQTEANAFIDFSETNPFGTP